MNLPWRVVVAIPPQFVEAAQLVFPPLLRPVWPKSLHEADLMDVLATADAVLAASTAPRITAAMIAAAPALAWIQCTGTGFDSVDVKEATARGIPVANVPGQNSSAVAEYVVAAAILLRRSLLDQQRQTLAGEFGVARQRALSRGPAEIRGACVGIIGLGAIGCKVAEAFKMLGARLLYTDIKRRTMSEETRYGVEFVALRDLCQVADIVTLHVPLADQTANLLDRDVIQLLKPGAVVINASRGGLMDEAALVAALAANRIAGAALDVYATEPPPSDHILIAAAKTLGSRLLLTPHTAGFTQESFRSMVHTAILNLDGACRGERPQYCVNPEVLGAKPSH